MVTPLKLLIHSVKNRFQARARDESMYNAQGFRTQNEIPSSKGGVLMSDTNWVSPSEHETGQYNDNFDQGRPPDSGFEKGNTEKRTDPPDPEGVSKEWKVTTFFKGTKTAQGTEDVFEQCDRCAGHDHKLITARGRAVTNPPVYAQEHCGTERFGDRSGQLSRFHVKGQEIRRLEITLIFADGSRAVPQIDWEQRLVDQHKVAVDSA